MGKATTASLHRTAAFSLAALVLYGPANILPILRLSMYGASSDNTVWEGCVRLYRDGDVPIAVVVFLASMAVPLFKILGLLVLTAMAWTGSTRWTSARTRLFKFIDSIGRWAMLDVFVLAILVSLVKLQRMATVIPGDGALAFIGVVVCTLLASASFDSRAIWKPREVRYE